jgi:hypothetical protein
MPEVAVDPGDEPDQSQHMPVVVAIALLLVAFCSGARLVRPLAHAGRTTGLPLDVELWHGVMGIAMVLMLLAPLSAVSSRAIMGVFVAAAVWCVFRFVRHASRAAYVRLGACCAAMLAMLAPSATGRSAGGGMSGMPGMASIAGIQPGTVPPVVIVSLLVAMGGVVLAGVGRIAYPYSASGGSIAMQRAQATGEMAMAAAMACMLAGLV